MNFIRNSKKRIQQVINARLHQYFPQYSPNYPLRKGKVSFVFIHINKTAGTSISKAIGLYRRQHLTAKEIIKIIGYHKWNRAYKFTVVRNPWDKVVSHYQYRIKTNQTNMQSNPISFSEWVKFTYGLEKNKFYYDQPKMFMPQVDWLLDHNEQLNLDLICKFENLEDDFEKVTQVIGCSSLLPHLNPSKRANYQDFYDSETKKIVEEWFKQDLELFGYQF
jgi:hypothetical protein